MLIQIIEILLNVLLIGGFLPYIIYKLNIEEKSLKSFICDQLQEMIESIVAMNNEVVLTDLNRTATKIGIRFGEINQSISYINKIIERFDFIFIRAYTYTDLIHEIEELVDKYELQLSDNRNLASFLHDNNGDFQELNKAKLEKEFEIFRRDLQFFIPLVKSL